MELKKLNSQEIELSSFKRFYGYVIKLSREMLDAHREKNNIPHDEFIELLISFEDEGKTVRMTYREFKQRILSQRALD